MANLPKKITKSVQRNIADESQEFLKATRRQVGLEKPQTQAEPQTPAGSEQELEEKKEKRLKENFLQAHREELKEIGEQRKQREEQWEKEQEEKMQAGNPPVGGEKPLIEPKTKPKRGLFAGVKTRVERLKRGSETRLPPSG